MCRTAQTRAARSGTIEAITGASACRITTMLFTIAVLVAVSAALIVYQGARCRAWRPGQSRVDEPAMDRRKPLVAIGRKPGMATVVHS